MLINNYFSIHIILSLKLLYNHFIHLTIYRVFTNYNPIYKEPDSNNYQAQGY